MNDLKLAPTEESGKQAFHAALSNGWKIDDMIAMEGMMEVQNADPFAKGFVFELAKAKGLDKSAVSVLSCSQMDDLMGHTHNERSIIGGPKKGDMWCNQWSAGVVA
jgi:hypothetical protein